jgi:hypothetical protein
VEVEANHPVTIDAEHDAFRWVAAVEAEHAFMWPGQRACVREICESILTPGPTERFLRLPDALPAPPPPRR